MDDGGSDRMGSARSAIGRDTDLEFIGSFLDRAAIEGGALLLFGDAGVGKTLLLEIAAARAAAVGTKVLYAVGAEFEADMSFAGLNQVLRPLFGELQRLGSAQCQALTVALGLDDGPPSSQLLVANAALALLCQAAAATPLLVIVDDLQWLDRASAVALAFVARRLGGSRVGVLAASRTGGEDLFELSGLPGYDLRPLDDVAAAALLEARFPALVPRVRQRLLAEAEGNPLALLELPVALSDVQRSSSRVIPAVLPLGQRLQAMFAARISELPSATFHLLLLAVLSGTGDLHLLQAARDGDRAIKGLAPAERVRLVRIDSATGRLVFRHPLIRSAIVEMSTSDQRRRAHQDLAERLSGQPERRVWHLAEAAVEPDERVAALLQGVAHANLRRGGGVAVITELLRAAELSPADSDRASRLAEAAYLGSIVTGDLRDAPRLLEAARQADPEHGGSLAAAVAGTYHVLNGDGDVDTAHRLMVGAIEALADSGDAHNKVLIEGLYTLLLVCFSGGRPELWEPFDAAISRLRPRPPELLGILAKTVSDPVRLALPALGRLDAAIAGLSQETIPARIVRTGIAAAYLDRLADCRAPLWQVVRDGREGGAVTSAIEALFLLGNDAFFSGQWEQATQVAEEGLMLCQIHGYRLLAWSGIFLQAVLAAARGDQDTTRALADQMAGWAAPRGVRLVQNYAWHAQALAALGHADFEDAYRYAAAVSPAGALASHVPHALWLIMDLVEAAVRSGRHAEAAAHVAAAHEAEVAGISPRLAMITRGSAALACTDETCGDLFENALATPGADRWPFDRARIQLAYGERLRRVKATTAARIHLAAARDTFERLQAHPWTVRAGSELRATGLSGGRAHAPDLASLTPQQRKIAQLAAAGLTNKQIGERLYLSPRTVGTHLHQLFPKLGVTTRAALRDALADLPPGRP